MSENGCVLVVVVWRETDIAEGLIGCIPHVRNPAIILARDTAALHV